MTTQTNITDEQRSVVSKIEKLMRLAGSNPNEAEASAAMQKAQDLLVAYNLDSSALSENGEDGKRADEKLKGGFYEFERQLIYWTSELNYCLSWSQETWVDRPENEQKHAKVLNFADSWKIKHKKIRQTRLVGRRVNVAATKAMISYLTQTIERLTREFVAPGLPTDAEGKVQGLSAALRSRRAVSFREGVAERVIQKICARREEMLDAERAEQRAAEERAAAAGTEVSSGTGLVLSSLKQSERDANMDHLYGEGFSARQRAERAARAEANRKADEEMAAWALAHPEEAAAAEAKRLKEAKSYRPRGGGKGSRGGSVGKERDLGAFNAGMRAGKDVGLDLQAAHKPAPRGIGHTVAALTTLRDLGA